VRPLGPRVVSLPWPARLEAAGISLTPIRETPDLVEDVPTCVDQHPTDLARCDVLVSAAILRDSPVTDTGRTQSRCPPGRDPRHPERRHPPQPKKKRRARNIVFC
jgi:hypothetical protein